jgi:hypothetical protein
MRNDVAHGETKFYSSGYWPSATRAAAFLRINPNRPDPVPRNRKGVANRKS